MRKFLLVLFLFVLGVILVLALSPWRMTLKTFNIIRDILPVEETELSKDVIREIQQKDSQTAFYIFRPRDAKKHPGMVISLGIHPEGAEDKRLQKIFQGLVQNGIVLITVDSKFLKDSLLDQREIKNLVEAFQLLEENPYVYSNKIGFFGLSVGSSLAFLAAADPEIKEKVKYIVWSGGYFDARELIIDVLSDGFLSREKFYPWEPSPRIKEALLKNLENFSQEVPQNQEIVAKIKNTQNREELEILFQNLNPQILQVLKSISPKTKVNEVKAPLFILHGKKDQLIPFSHSVLLSQIYPGEKTMIISERYGHISPERPSLKDLFSKEFWQALFLSNKLLTKIF